MATLTDLKTFLTGKPRVKILKHESNLLEFTINHKGGLTRKTLMNELMSKYANFKIKSLGENSGVKTYQVYT